MDIYTVNQLSVVLLTALVLAFAAFLLWLGSRSYKASTQLRMQRAESFNRLLERFSSAKEFTDFLQTEEGKKFLGDPLPASRTSSNRILRLIQYGIVIFALGVGCLINAYRLRDFTDLHYASQAQDCQFWGIFGVIIGVALVATAMVSSSMARKWHLLNGNGKQVTN
jgi:hypothetical protein